MPEPQSSKARARAELRSRLAGLSPPDLAGLSARIVARIMGGVGEVGWGLPEYAAARTILMFVPMSNRPEVDLRPLIQSALDAGKAVALPRTDWATRTMTPRRITDLAADLEPDAAAPAAAGLHHPRATCPIIPPDELDLLLTPGLGFDLTGGRIGRGAGFYDRFLAQPRIQQKQGGRALVCGVGFEAQVLPPGQTLPRDAHDHPLGALVTEARTLRFGSAAHAEPR